ncbi:MAG TPA: pitrilysin family protein, partial [Elusimicrobiota bacterium]|nr:pitrilysin family protein [Elusimicrobiota bacterium]
LQIYVRCGAVNETDASAGVSHFLEHMIFKGTDRLDAGKIAQVVERRGGSINAATGTEMTHYYVDMPSDSLDEAFEVLTESVLRPAFPPEELEKERRVILEEIKRRNDNPESDLWDAFLETLYRETPYRRQVIGTAASIAAMPRDTLFRQHHDYYVPENMVVVVAGDLRRATVEKKIKLAFGAVPARTAPARPPLVEPAPSNTVLKFISRPAQQAHVAVGFLGPTLQDPEQVAMDVLATALGGGQSSPLYQILREQKRAVWSVGASFLTHAGSGVFGIFAECPPEKARSLSNEIYFILDDALGNGLPPEALARAKAQLRSAWLFSQETYHGQAAQWGFYTILDRPQLARNYLKELDKVTLADLHRLLLACFQRRELSGAVLLPETSGGDAPRPAAP